MNLVHFSLLQNNVFEQLQVVGQLVRSVSCKTLTVDRPYKVLAFEKMLSNFVENQTVMLATLTSEGQLAPIKVYLPSRFGAEHFSDEFVEKYNKCVDAEKWSLVYKGMCGRCIVINFVKP